MNPLLAALAWYGLLSVLTFAHYALDKRAARRGLWRVSEARLHGLALLGGWPGALAARKLLRHKSSKRGFGLVLLVCVVSNLALVTLVVWLTPALRELVASD
ncbi:DUF1294 domain-containing protein [Burkholderiaceae bacterium UC74_6]